MTGPGSGMMGCGSAMPGSGPGSGMTGGGSGSWVIGWSVMAFLLEDACADTGRFGPAGWVFTVYEVMKISG